MKAVFADATELQVQSMEEIGGALRILTIGTLPEKLREIFSDPVKTKTIIKEKSVLQATGGITQNTFTNGAGTWSWPPGQEKR